MFDLQLISFPIITYFITWCFKNVLDLIAENYTIYWKYYGFMHCIEVKIKPCTSCNYKNICFNLFYFPFYYRIQVDNM